MSQAEGVSPAYAAKILRVLRKGGFRAGRPGARGGYTLARPPSRLSSPSHRRSGGRLFESKFWPTTIPASPHLHAFRRLLRPFLWRAVQIAVDQY